MRKEAEGMEDEREDRDNKKSKELREDREGNFERARRDEVDRLVLDLLLRHEREHAAVFQTQGIIQYPSRQLIVVKGLRGATHVTRSCCVARRHSDLPSTGDGISIETASLPRLARAISLDYDG